MIRELEILHAVTLKADSFYERAQELGKTSARALEAKGKAQMKNLETVANSALKGSDVWDYIKRQTARHEDWQRNSFGAELLAFLQDNIKQASEDVCNRWPLLPAENDERRNLSQKVYLMLLKEFIRQMVIHYEFELSGVRR